MNTNTVLAALQFFDNSCEGCDYIKDCILLDIATAIAISVIIMDRFYRVI